MIARTLALFCLVPLVSACERGMHDMYDQPRYKRGAEAPLFEDGVAARRTPEGTVAQDDPDAVPSTPRITMALLKHGRERYTVFCAPCHGAGGDGDGMVVRRGFPAPPGYHDARLRQADDAHFYDVITHGYGVMYPYGDRLDPADRLAVIAYIRALQLSRNAPVGALTPDDIARLNALPAQGKKR